MTEKEKRTIENFLDRGSTMDSPNAYEMRAICSMLLDIYEKITDVQNIVAQKYKAGKDCDRYSL